MDQLTVRDELGTMGYGGFKYGIVLCKVKDNYWDFLPLRTLKDAETKAVFRSFCLTSECKANSSLISCGVLASFPVGSDQLGYSRRHPPPARPQAIVVIEGSESSYRE